MMTERSRAIETRTCVLAALMLALSVTGSTGAQENLSKRSERVETGGTWRGLRVAPEHRCQPYKPDDFPDPQDDVKARIVRELGGTAYSPYTCEVFHPTGQGEAAIDRVVPPSEAHDSGLCAADRVTRARFASDLRNLTLGSFSHTFYVKGERDAGEWQPERNACWYAERVVEVRQAYNLTIDRREADSLENMLRACATTTIACTVHEHLPKPPPVLRYANCTTMRTGGWRSGVTRHGTTYNRTWTEAEKRTYVLNRRQDVNGDGRACVEDDTEDGWDDSGSSMGK